MEEVRAHLKNLRIAPKKVRMVTALLKRMDVRSAEAHLEHLHQRSAAPLLKLLRSCVANAEHNNRLAKQDLYVKEVRVDAGQTLRRQSRTWHGMAHPLLKRSSHVTILVASRQGTGRAEAEMRSVKTPEQKTQHVHQKTTARTVNRNVQRSMKATKQGAGKTRLFNRKAI